MRLYLLLFLFITILFLGQIEARESALIWHKIKIKQSSYYYNRTGVLFSTQFMSELSRLAKENKIPASKLNYRFSTYEFAQYVLRGKYVVLEEDESKVTAIISLINLDTGTVELFEATDDAKKVVTKLAKRFFDHFQLVKNNKWTSIKDRVSSFKEAKLKCEAVGSRLPYTKELLAASTVGGYEKGGIELDYSNENFYAVRDKANLDESDYNYYYYTGNESQIIYNGRFLSDAGGKIFPKVICIREKISKQIRSNEELFDLHRTTVNKEAKKIIRYLISKSDSIASESVKYRGIRYFDSIKEAKDYLKKYFRIIIE